MSSNGITLAQRLVYSGVDFAHAGENIAMTPTAELGHLGLMNSPPHRANILSLDYTVIGIGICDVGMHGKMFTQEFAGR